MFNRFPGAELAEKQNEDPSTSKAPNSSVTFIYEANVVGLSRNVTITWSKNVMNYSLVISVENPSDESQYYTCKIDLKAWQFWGKKGLKSFDVDGKRVDVYWDFRQAKFSSNPEPSSDYYVAMVYEEEVVLLIGDLEKDAFKRIKKRPSVVDPVLLCKKENVYGKRSFCTKAMLHNGRAEHDVAIEFSLSGLGDPEMWISVDGYEVIHVMNLHWRFRGNENVTFNDVVVEIFWDVHDWVYNSNSTPAAPAHGLFILKPVTPESCDDNAAVAAADGSCSTSTGGDSCDTPRETPSAPDFFHVIYAWKIE
ncbi:hypothetical protein Tsubulata_016410 [Turnera subulata]|uniref:DUF868 domain-containing protein n=1 Tax=Turnera subulata TaxID=218843 RepID=A0A9Q0FL04_9ROSI|nr:hypothetical protein Tsubulata_016410 [Turnera subulata]